MWMRRITLVLLLVAAVEIVALGIRGLLGDTLISPLLYVIWGAVRIFESVPQGVVWLAFVLTMAVVAIASLWAESGDAIRRRMESGPRGRVFDWLRLVTLAQRHDYSRWRLAQRLALLLAETIAERDRVELRVARQRLATSTIDAPPQVVAFLRAGLEGYRQRQGLFARRRQPSPLDADLEQVVAAVERLIA